MKKVVIESHVPAIPEGLARDFEIVRLNPEEITRESVADADALIVRTRTRCDAALLEGSRVKFVATATIGTDHLDLEWLRANGIEAVNAPGCNAPAVAQYVFASLMRHPRFHAILSDGADFENLFRRRSIAVVGVGHVGSIVARWAEWMGMEVHRVDPPRQRAEGGTRFCGLNEAVANADIVTFHTPLTRTGEDATFHIANAELFDRCRPGAIVVNAARGPIVDTEALLKAVGSRKLDLPIIDCWEGEPKINRELLATAAIATPHIAGYSAEGKQRASQMAVNALCRHFGVKPPEFPPLHDTNGVGMEYFPGFAKAIYDSYNPIADTEALRADPAQFESLRNSYHLRQEPVSH